MRSSPDSNGIHLEAQIWRRGDYTKLDLLKQIEVSSHDRSVQTAGYLQALSRHSHAIVHLLFF